MKPSAPSSLSHSVVLLFAVCLQFVMVSKLVWAESPIVSNIQPAPGPGEVDWNTVQIDTAATEGIRLKSTAKPSWSLSIDTGLREVAAFGLLQNSIKSAAPHLLIKGRPMGLSNSEPSLFLLTVHTQTNRSKLSSPQAQQFVYPGTITDPKTGERVYEARAFFGSCLSNRPAVYVSFQKEKVDRKHKSQPSVFIAEPVGDLIEETLIERRPPSIQATLKAVKRGTCKEIAGISRRILAKPLDLTPRKNGDESTDLTDDAKETNRDE